MNSHQKGLKEGIRRLTLQAVDSPLDDNGSGGLAPDGVVLITEDDQGLAELVAVQLEARGIRTIRFGGAERPVNWESTESLDAIIAEARSEGPIVGLIHLLPLSSIGRIESGAISWIRRVTVEARTLFLLAKALIDDLELASVRGGSCLIAATGMGGTFASTSEPAESFFPGQGAIAGLIKTLAREWESVRCRVVDVDLSESGKALAEQLALEAITDDDWSEVGYFDGRRIRLQTVPSKLVGVAKPLEIRPGDPVLITGGARGITSLVALELARRWQPTLLLMGTTPLPPEHVVEDLHGLNNPSELKAFLFDQMSRSGRSPSPGELERTYQTLVRGRELLRNIEALRAAGSRVVYQQVDVRDSAKMAQVIGEWRAQYGDPVGVIHGAGLIKDKLLRDKSSEMFDRVLGTKLDGALNLIDQLDPTRLKFTVLFSSIAGRFGNRGQSDYSAANEVLNKLAIWLDRRWQGRVVSMIWGPWSGVGMVSDLEAHLGSQGLGMIAPELGVSALLDELTQGRKGEVEVIVSGNLGTLDGPVGRMAEPMEVGR